MSALSINREDVLKDGLVFDAYNCPIHNHNRQKLIINTRSLGSFAMHGCLYCKITELNSEAFYVYHIKPLRKRTISNCTNETALLSKRLKYTLLHLKRENDYDG